ncbi:MAG: T9SS type A sorting domain-containing protein [Rhodothermaceae bacterium]|nr:T9SS type A sorting domain-containing protein [Rhodothermaceae bacterium]
MPLSYWADSIVSSQLIARGVVLVDGMRTPSVLPLLLMRPFALALALSLVAWPVLATPVNELVPAVGPFDAVAVPFTPEGLSGATDALAADYLRPDGRHLGALLATAPSATYDPIQAFAVFTEGTAGALHPVLLDGHPFDRIEVTRDDGSVVYAVGFTAYRERGVFVVDGRHMPTLPEGAEAFHIVTWAASAEAAAGLAAASLARLAAFEPIAFVQEALVAPASLAASTAAPNPFATTTTLRFELSAPATMDLAVYDLLGRRVAQLARGAFEAGPHAIPFEAAALAAGVYVVRFMVDDHLATQRITRR